MSAYGRARRVRADQVVEADGPVRVGIYIRVSTAREEMISPELQQRDVDRFLDRMAAISGRPWTVVMTEKDLDKSGRSFARAGIQRLSKAAANGNLDKIVTYRFDRFGRNLTQTLDHLRTLEAAGCEVLSATEPLDASTAIGQFQRSNALLLAELQSKQIEESWKRVGEYRVERGLPSDGRDRYGYLKHRKT